MDHAVHVGKIFGFGAIPAVGPAADLAFDESGWLTEAVESALFDVDGVHARLAIDERFADARAMTRLRFDLGRDGGAEDGAAAALHEKEDGADDGRVFTEMIHA